MLMCSGEEIRRVHVHAPDDLHLETAEMLSEYHNQPTSYMHLLPPPTASKLDYVHLGDKSCAVFLVPFSTSGTSPRWHKLLQPLDSTFTF